MFTEDETSFGIRTEAPRSPRTKKKKRTKSPEGPDPLVHGDHSFPKLNLPTSDATTHLQNGTV